ncbi:MAG TPA: GNAT family N-acetyltransferase [Jatrophihabitans sp.]|jgi:ribosomal protein S18 acetylase RimI-like enzyme|uniref:GNAT family N-acetyltransferase n=1 Tax=Jatrophihabitans sp. TaxID=1932789 RepID=UPI002E067943|nr:GNAT family N-acetyltransferase [Jatrophihabitans sp.]
MTAAPQPMPHHIERRFAGAADSRLVRQMLADTRDDLLLMPSDVRDTVVEMQVHAERCLIAAEYPGATHEILVADGTDVGRLVVDVAGPEVRVIDLTISRGHRRHGLATAVLRDVLADAGRRPVTITVKSTNTAGRALLRGLGFAETCDSSGHVVLAHHN